MDLQTVRDARDFVSDAGSPAGEDAVMGFDILAYTRHLKAVGFTDVQAEVLMEAHREMIADELVTREFLQSELAATKAFLRSELAAVVDRMRSETDHLQSEINRLRSEITQLMLWMGASAVIAVAAIAVIIKL